MCHFLWQDSPLTFAHSAKRLLATWRILGGVWLPRRWDISFNALTPYTTLVTPPENPYLTKKEPKVEATGTTSNGTNLHTATPTASTPEVNPAGTSRAPGTTSNDKKEKKEKSGRTPRRRLVRHVLRARVEAAKALEVFLTALQRDGGRVSASARLASQFGQVNEDGSSGTRDVREVLAFLKARGAVLSVLRGVKAQDEWDERWGLSSGDEGTTTHDELASPREDDVVWVPRVVQRD